LIIRYNPKLKNIARELRKSGNLSEALLWNQLKGKKMKGYQFMRQKPVDEYIVDFFCGKLNLAIEIDGESHSARPDEDRDRQNKLESLGIRFLRFNDREVNKNMGNVLQAIEEIIEEIEKQPPVSPFSKGE
jgi:very-short-patch-repair endonuclease